MGKYKNQKLYNIRTSIKLCVIILKIKGAKNKVNIKKIKKRTHEAITRYNINDEHELYNLCELRGWRTEWYENYLE